MAALQWHSIFGMLIAMVTATNAAIGQEGQFGIGFDFTPSYGCEQNTTPQKPLFMI
jgi:hypothetical protein